MTETILNVEPLGYSPRARATWERAGAYFEGTLQAPIAADTTVLIVRLAARIDEVVLSRFPKLRYLVSATTGLDHIDLEALSARGVELVSLRGETEFLGSVPSTAEHTMALMLALLRHVADAAASVGRGEWSRDRFRGRQLKGRRLGLVGLGRTGLMVAGYATAFGMQVGYYDPAVTSAVHRRFDNLREMFRDSEIVSLHVSLDEETRGLVDRSLIAEMRPGAWLINTSRGALVDEAALAARVRNGSLGGVATDVLAMELDDISASPLWQAMRDGFPVLITPHLGGATEDAMHQCEEFIAARFVELHGAGIRR